MENLVLEQIAAALAHEVKNPLSLVKANLDILETNEAAVLYEKNYSMIRRELNKIDQLLLEFLTIATPVNINSDLVYIVDILKNITEKYQSSFKNISFNLTYFSDDITVFGNEKSLSILFHNIIKNAVEAMDTNKFGENQVVSISLTTWGNDLTIEISDTGCGIACGQETAITSDFYTTKKMGTGLGLGICHKIAEDHKGSFAIKNGVKGCVVKVVLPLTHV